MPTKREQLEELRNAATASDTPLAAETYARRLTSHGMFSEAVKVWERAAWQAGHPRDALPGPSPARALLELARAHDRLGNVKEAWRNYDNALTREQGTYPPESVETSAAIAAADFLYRNGNVDQAHWLIDEELSRDPYSHDPHGPVRPGEIPTLRADFIARIAEGRKPRYRAKKAELHLRSGELAEAQQVLEGDVVRSDSALGRELKRQKEATDRLDEMVERVTAERSASPVAGEIEVPVFDLDTARRVFAEQMVRRGDDAEPVSVKAGGVTLTADETSIRAAVLIAESGAPRQGVSLLDRLDSAEALVTKAEVLMSVNERKDSHAAIVAAQRKIASSDVPAPDLIQRIQGLVEVAIQPTKLADIEIDPLDGPELGGQAAELSPTDPVDTRGGGGIATGQPTETSGDVGSDRTKSRPPARRGPLALADPTRQVGTDPATGPLSAALSPTRGPDGPGHEIETSEVGRAGADDVPVSLAESTPTPQSGDVGREIAI